MGYVWCDGYVWDMCGVRYVWDMCGARYANNLLKNPATKRLSGKMFVHLASRKHVYIYSTFTIFRRRLRELMCSNR